MTAEQNVIAKTQRRNSQQNYLAESMGSAARAVNKLQREGFTVEGVVVGKGRPQITIFREQRCPLLGEARIYNGLEGKRYVVSYEACQVIWHE